MYNTPLEALKHHVTGAIERGEKQAIAEQSASNVSIELKTAEVDGKKIAYSTATDFLVQVGHGRGAYKTVATYTGNLAGAVICYKGYNIHSGYKKRLLMPSCSKNPVIARYISPEAYNL